MRIPFGGARCNVITLLNEDTLCDDLSGSAAKEHSKNIITSPINRDDMGDNNPEHKIAHVQAHFPLRSRPS